MAPSTQPSTWLTVRFKLMKININFIANCQRDISQAVISVSADTRPTFWTGAIAGRVGRWELKASISVLPIVNNRGLGLMQTSGSRWNSMQGLNHSFPCDFNLITCKFNSIGDQCSLWGRKYLTGDWHGYVRCTDDWRWSYQGRWGRAVANYIDATVIRRLRLMLIW